jgi:hypothetical protein
LVVLAYLLRNGSERVVTSAREHIYDLRTLENYSFVDENGKDQGVNIRHKVKELIDFVQDDDKLREERKKAKKNKDKYIGMSNDTMGFSKLEDILWTRGSCEGEGRTCVDIAVGCFFRRSRMGQQTERVGLPGRVRQLGPEEGATERRKERLPGRFPRSQVECCSCKMVHIIIECEFVPSGGNRSSLEFLKIVRIHRDDLLTAEVLGSDVPLCN